MLDKLKSFFIERASFYLTRYNRLLPFGDTIVDRWEKAKILGFGEGTSIYDNSLVLGDVIIANDTWVGPNTVLDGSGGGLSIGAHCSISAGVQIYTHDTVNRSISGGVAPIDIASTSIGNRVYIGPNAIVAKGVTIGDGAVIGANSLVMCDVPEGKKCYGTPGKILD